MFPSGKVYRKSPSYHTARESSKLTPVLRCLSIPVMRSSKTWIVRVSIAVVMALALVSLAGCGGKPFNVKTRPDPPQTQITGGARAESNGVTILAEAVTDEDYLYETFDANLILAGILPVLVKLTNGGEGTVGLKKAKFEIKNAAGRWFEDMDAKRAYKQLISYYGVSIYSKPGYRESRADFSSYALEFEEPLGSGQSRQGMIFFRVPGETVRANGLTLSISRLYTNGVKSDSAVELKLN